MAPKLRNRHGTARVHSRRFYDEADAIPNSNRRLHSNDSVCPATHPSVQRTHGHTIGRIRRGRKGYRWVGLPTAKCLHMSLPFDFVTGNKCRSPGASRSVERKSGMSKRMRRVIANSNERKRMQNINAGFETLRYLMPHLQGEKLSKVSLKFPRMK